MLAGVVILHRYVLFTELSHDQPLAIQPAAVSVSAENSVQPSQSKIGKDHPRSCKQIILTSHFS